jgi:hypothetical protein
VLVLTRKVKPGWFREASIHLSETNAVFAGRPTREKTHDCYDRDLLSIRGSPAAGGKPLTLAQYALVSFVTGALFALLYNLVTPRSSVA